MIIIYPAIYYYHSLRFFNGSVRWIGSSDGFWNFLVDRNRSRIWDRNLRNRILSHCNFLFFGNQILYQMSCCIFNFGRGLCDKICIRLWLLLVTTTPGIWSTFSFTFLNPNFKLCQPLLSMFLVLVFSDYWLGSILAPIVPWTLPVTAKSGVNTFC